MLFKRDFFIAAYLLCIGAADTDCSSDIQVSSQADADKIASCGNYTGTITINGGDVFTFNSLTSVKSLIAKNVSVSSISAPQLQVINDELDLEELTYLGTLSMPLLSDVGSITLQTLPQLQELQFNAGVQRAGSVVISDTYLSSLQGLNLSDISIFNINNNNNIQSINVSITSVSNALDISFNSQSVNVSLPQLVWANNATFRFCGSVDAPKLETINASLGFINNSVSTLGFDKLDSVGSLAVTSNSKLTNISFAGITELDGALVVANNTKLRSITGFPNVKTIRGALTLEGDFTQAKMPSLNRVEGDVLIETNSTFDCSDFNSAHSNGDFFGDKYVCEGASSTVSTNINTSTQTGGDSGSSSSASATGSSSSKSSSSHNGAQPAAGQLGIAGLAAALFSLL